jgi:hypothetical protein
LVYDTRSYPRKKLSKTTTVSALIYWSRAKCYALLYLTIAVGYGWLLYSYFALVQNTTSVDVCLVKHFVGIPCPSCGSTRSVMALMQGNLLDAALINPMGLCIAVIMLVAPVWATFDLFTKQSTLIEFYGKAEKIIARPTIAIPLIALILLNWIWNITKGL